MKKLIAALLMCCSTVAYGQNTVQQPVTETTYKMNDDGTIKVTLPFTFTYYNKQFTDTWMYDNGVISFLQPGSQGSLSPWQWYAQPLNQTNANYYIASLWADIAPVSITKYITQTDGTYMKYTWQNIAEYYSAYGNWRLNTFSTTLKNDGTIETHYTNINLQTSAIGVGTVGDKNAGEVNQIYYSPCCVATTTAMIPDWTIAGVPPPPPPPPPPTPTSQPEVYVTPQVIEEPTTQPVATTVTVEPETTPVVVTTNTTTVVATAVVQAATESSPASITTASTIAATTSATSSDSSSNKISVTDAQSIARTNQKNASQLVNSVVSSSIENSVVQSVNVDTDTNSSNDMVVSNTNTSSTSSTTNNLTTQSNNSVTDTGTNNAIATSSSMNLANFARLPGAFAGDTNTESNENRVISNSDNTEVNSQETKLAASNSELVNTATDEVNPTSVRSLAANNVPAKQVEEEQEKKNVEIADMNKDSSVSELASFGVRLTELQVLPIGYNIYLAAVLKDAPFYAPKAIYRNQTVVDNAPAQRLLQFASDAKFDQMVSQQYGEK